MADRLCAKAVAGWIAVLDGLSDRLRRGNTDLAGPGGAACEPVRQHA
jgi:hypothetical protein